MMQTQLNILGMGLKKCFNPKAITGELGSLSIKDYLLLSILLASQVVAFFLSGTFDSMSSLSLIVGIVTIVNLILVNRGRLTNFTFGIVATDQQGNIYTYDDITTSMEYLEKFVAFLNEENVSLKCFKIFLELFIDSL